MRDPAKALYNDVIDYLNEWYPYQVRHVLLMGSPVESTEVPFAMVTWEDAPKTFGKAWRKPTFHLNHENVASLKEEERSFIFLHETYHVLLNHNFLPFDNQSKANIAADIVINDYLVHLGLPEIEGLYYGENSIGFNSFGLTVREVYQLLKDDLEKPEGSSAISDLLGGSGSGDAEPGDGSCGQQHQEPNQAPKDVLDQAPRALRDAQKAESELGGKLAGSGHTDLKAWAEQEKVDLRWAEILKDLHPTVFGSKKGVKRRMTFNRLNRKVAYGAPNLILPVYTDTVLEGQEPKKTVRVVLAIDTSDSISNTTKNRFLRIAKSIPRDKIELRTISFTTRVDEFDFERPRFRTGGTAFSPIETWINKNYPEYPDAVIMFTDGEAGFADGFPARLDRWYWFLCDRPNLYNSKVIRGRSKLVEPLERFVK